VWDDRRARSNWPTATLHTLPLVQKWDRGLDYEYQTWLGYFIVVVRKHQIHPDIHQSNLIDCTRTLQCGDRDETQRQRLTWPSTRYAWWLMMTSCEMRKPRTILAVLLPTVRSSLAHCLSSFLSIEQSRRRAFWCLWCLERILCQIMRKYSPPGSRSRSPCECRQESLP
jgi:hypothetical protein